MLVQAVGEAVVRAAERRDAGCQTAAAASAARAQAPGAHGGWCAAAGACARVTRSAADQRGVADVLIVLLHHQHALPPTAPHAVPALPHDHDTPLLLPLHQDAGTPPPQYHEADMTQRNLTQD